MYCLNRGPTRAPRSDITWEMAQRDTKLDHLFVIGYTAYVMFQSSQRHKLENKATPDIKWAGVRSSDLHGRECFGV